MTGAVPRIDAATGSVAWPRLVLAFGTRARDAALATSLVLVNLYCRWVRLEPIENGGDPLDAWFIVRQWAHAGNAATATLNHHSARFGMHWLTWLDQALFGTDPRYYYVPQLFASCACVGLVYLLGRQVSGRVAGVLSAAWLMQYDQFHSASCQLRRGIFETMYVLAAVNCVVRFLAATTARSQQRWLVACACFAFLGYLTELPALYIAPGVALAVWLSRRSARDVLLFAGVLFALFLLETAAYSLFTKYWGRLGVLTSRHGQIGMIDAMVEPVPFSYLLERFTDARPGVKLVYFAFFVSGPLAVWRGQPRVRAVALAGLAYVLLQTFLVRSIHPLLVFEKNHDRYLLLGIPPAIVVTVAVALGVATWALGRVGPALMPGARGRFQKWAAPAGAVGLAGVLAFLVWDAEKNRSEPHPLAEIERTYGLVNDALARGLPIVARLDPLEVAGQRPRARALHWAVKGFVRDQYWLVGDELPNYTSASFGVLEGRYAYIPQSLPQWRVDELLRRKCAVRLEVERSWVRASPRGARLDPTCDADARR
jgi:dolichyl-phosphate-mannose-protein mannosyltransferase